METKYTERLISKDRQKIYYKKIKIKTGLTGCLEINFFGF